MPDASRRGFLRELGLSAARNLRDSDLVSGRSALGSVVAQLTAEPEQTDTMPTIPPPPPRAQAMVPAACLSHDQLEMMIAEEGLVTRAHEITGLARRSIRLTPLSDSAGAEAWFDVGALTRLSEPTQTDQDEPETLMMAQVSLAAPALRNSGLAAGEAGRWLVTFLETVPLEVAESVSVSARRANAVMLGEPAEISESMQPFALHETLVVPRVWSAPVQTLELSTDEHDAYVRLRDRIAEAQGVEVEQDGGAGTAHHHLLGYPDETTGAMQGDCSAIDGDGDWAVFAQLSVGGRQRMYAWSRTPESPQALVVLIR